MGTIPHVLHRSARPIRPAEFADAIQAICRPRVHTPGSNPPIPVSLAISGGVDSMAMAYLCSEMQRQFPFMRVADHPVQRFAAVVVDHGCRRYSAEESATVAHYLKGTLGIRTTVTRIWWQKLRGLRVNTPDDMKSRHLFRPQDLPNFETLAREQRYRHLAAAMLQNKSVSLFLAHHEDDQYETLLMRLMNGHGPRGLVGIPAANELPHTQDMHGSYASGLIDDQTLGRPIYTMNISKSESREVREILREQMMVEGLMHGSMARQSTSAQPDMLSYLESLRGDAWATQQHNRRDPDLVPCRIEDGGMMLYRPMLEFSKDRIIATCLENGIPWFEDHTNADATMTQRNAVRHMVKNHTMPVALQKPAVLAMSKRINRRFRLQAQEADRLFDRLVLHEFQPNVGTITARFPHLRRPKPRRRSSVYTARWREGGLERKRAVAAEALRRLLRVVSPLTVLPTAEDLQPLVPRLFPSLHDEGAPAPPPPPRSFVVSGVHCVPLQPRPGDRDGDRALRWQFARAPYASPAREPLPLLAFRSHVSPVSLSQNPSWWLPPEVLHGKGFKYRQRRFRRYDGGRFWVFLKHRLPNDVLVGPLATPYLRPFRDALPTEAARRRLDDLLKRYAGSKVRWTLPAVYVVGPVDWLRDEAAADPRSPMPRPRQDEVLEQVLSFATNEMHLVSLPTLDISLPGLDTWLQSEFRFRKVDRAVPMSLERTRLQNMLAMAGLGKRIDKRPPCVSASSRRKRPPAVETPKSRQARHRSSKPASTARLANARLL